MKLHIFVLTLGLAVLLLSTAALANGNGHVMIKINGHWPGDPAPQLVAGCDFNRFEIWIQNDAPLYQISIAFSLDGEDLAYSFRTPYGSLPPEARMSESMEPQSALSILAG